MTLQPDREEIEGPEDGSAQGSAQGSPQRPRRPGLGRLARLCLKELREILRDRRTIVTLVLMPLLVYPLLSLGFQRLLLTSLGAAGQLTCVVAVTPEAEGEHVQRFLTLGDALLRQTQPPAQPVQKPSGRKGPRPLSTRVPEPRIQWVAGANLEQEVVSGSVDLAILVQRESVAGVRGDRASSLRCELISREGSTVSKAALDYVQDRLRAVNERYVRKQLELAGQGVRYPVQTASRIVRGTGAAFSLTTLIPLVLILMTMTGAVYPAIDLTAGERERGTLEALMAAPVPRLELLAAKYVAVVTVALLTASANLLAMTITLVTTGLGKVLFGDAGLPPWVLVEVLALLVLFAGFFSAVLLALTSFARSFKEAQAYLIPVMLLSLAPGLISLMPGVEFNGLLAVTPLVNIVLLARGLFDGTADPTLAAVAVLATALYAVAAIGLAARVFGTDAILYGSEASWSDLFRRPAGAARVPRVSSAMLCLALLFPCYFLVAGLLAQMPYDSPSTLLILNGVATAVLFAGFPTAAAMVQRLPLRETFRLNAARLPAWAGAVMLGLCLWPLAHEIYLLNELIGLATLSQERIELAHQLLASWREVSPWVIVAALAAAPAVCEELLFRGYLLRALLAATSERHSIVLSAVLFGGFHVVATDALATERLLPSTFLGLILGWVAWRTASVVPGMVLHACHNGLLLMLAYYRDELAARGWGLQEQSHMPLAWLAVAATGLIVGLSLLWMGASGAGRTSEKVPK
ncbi:MAG: CPBP family intramembrane metalloprotease [Candidatus Anammoximicrobium sp.]|nr:CPBP family intramembrane metalloprotease [Candidatus Anammoximicrobium sp.]